MPAIHDSVTRATPQMNITARFAGLGTVMLWGSAFVAIRAAGETITPGALALGRVLVASIILSVIGLIWHKPLPARPDLVKIAIYGVLFQGMYSVALNQAERLVDAGTAAMLVGSGPLLIAILAGIFLQEGFPQRLFTGCAIAFVGTSIIGMTTSQAGSQAAIGVLFAMIAVLAYATAVVVQKSVLARATALQVTWLGSLAATLVLLPLTPSLIRDVREVGITALGWIAYLGNFPTTIGFVLWNFALRRTYAGRMGAMIYLVSPIAVLLGWILLNETLPWLAVAGGALCLGGVYLAHYDYD
jgi:drug/metabolite transporter (DMT)-like permease